MTLASRAEAAPGEALAGSAVPFVPPGALATAAHLALCAVAAAIPTDELIVTLTGVDRAAFAPTLHTGLLAAALWLPLLLRGPWAGRHLAPVLLLSGAMIAGVVVLVVQAALDEVRIEPRHLAFHPFKFAVLGTLFATAALDARWRRRLRASYLAGWAVFVAYAAWAIATGSASFTRNAGDLVRVAVAGLNENQQATLVATGMVIALAELLEERRRWRVAGWAAALMVAGAVFVFGASRGATIGLVAGAAFVTYRVVRDDRLRRGSIMGLSAGLACALAVVLALGPVRDATSTLATRFQASVERHELGDRDRLAGATLRIAARHPWSGVGFGRAAEHLGGDPHNAYLKILAEGGAPAAVLLIAGLVATAAMLRRVRAGPELGAAAALVVLLVTALVGQSLMRPPFWFFLGSVSAATLARSVRERWPAAPAFRALP